MRDADRDAREGEQVKPSPDLPHALIDAIHIAHAYTQAEQAIVAGDWPHVCPYCSRSFQSADRWFPYCGPQCAIDAEMDQ